MNPNASQIDNLDHDSLERALQILRTHVFSLTIMNSPAWIYQSELCLERFFGKPSTALNNFQGLVRSNQSSSKAAINPTAKTTFEDLSHCSYREFWNNLLRPYEVKVEVDERICNLEMTSPQLKTQMLYHEKQSPGEINETIKEVLISKRSRIFKTPQGQIKSLS